MGIRESISADDDVGIERWPRALAAASFTAGGIETLSMSREAGQPLIPNQGRLALSSGLYLINLSRFVD
jgi:hypothetical protein